MKLLVCGMPKIDVTRQLSQVLALPATTDIVDMRTEVPHQLVGYDTRLQSGWAKCEPKKKGRYEFAWLDHHVDGLIELGIHPWMCLCYGNPLYTDGGKDLNARLFGDGPIMDAWLKYVQQVVRRYKGKVRRS